MSNGLGTWSSAYEAAERFQLGPSRMLRRIVVAGSLGGAMLAFSALPGNPATWLFAGYLLGIGVLCRQALSLPLRLLYLGADGWALQRQGQPPRRQPVRAVLLHPDCCILITGSGWRRRPLVFGADACPAGEHRRLRRRLRLDGE